MLKTIFKLLLGGVLALLVAIAALLILMMPPHLSVPEVEDLSLAGLVVVDPTVGRCQGCTLQIRDGRILGYGATTPSDASEEFAGFYALPGLVDLHVHHPPALAVGQRSLFSLLFLAHGVTSVRDAGAFLGNLRGYRDRIRDGKQPGPRNLFLRAFLGWHAERLVLLAFHPEPRACSNDHR